MINDLDKDNQYYNGDMIPTFKRKSMKEKDIITTRRSIVKRLFFLRQAENRATDPSFKAMWYFKRTQLLNKYEKLGI